MQKSNIKGSLILVLAALIWGLAFVVQNDAADKIPPFTFNCLRSIIGAAFLFAFMGVKSVKNKDFVIIPKQMDKKILLIGALACGAALAVSTNFQQFGIAFYPEGAPVEARSGFITALYVVLVPLLSIFAKKKVPLIVWGAVLVAIAGFYMLCLFDGVSGFYLADLLVLGCTFTFSLHIIVIDKYCNIIGGVRLSAFQFVVSAIISGILALIFELDVINASSIVSVIPQILYMGIMSSGIAYTLQIVGQRYAEPAIASLSMSLESVFAALGGWVITGNALKGNEIIGCLLVFGAIILAQIPEFKKISN